MAGKKQVVIVGGGIGALLARTLSGKLDRSKYDITLISSHPWFIWFIAAIRMVVTDEGKLENEALIPFDKLFINGNGTFKQGTVTAIEATNGSSKGGNIVLEDRSTVPYDVLVLATGSNWKDTFCDLPTDSEKTKVHIQKWRKDISQARHIVIAGGGSVGIEFSGEIKHYFPKTKVTIVHAGEKLLNSTYPDKFRRNMERRLRAIGVEVLTGDYIDSMDATHTRNGVPLDADFIINARGPKPNTDFIGSSLGADALTRQGRVRVKPTFQLQGYKNIFAIGDITDFEEQKQIGKYNKHVTITAENVQAVLGGNEPSKEYALGPEMILVTLGKKSGAGFFGLLWGIMVGGWVTKVLKSDGLFVSRTQKLLGKA